MLISTANDLPGYEITEVLGEVFGLTVRSRNIGSQFGAGLKSIMGGELKGMTDQPGQSRNEVIQRMVERGDCQGRRRHRRDAFRHLGDGWHVDGDLRLRHRRHRQRVTAPTPKRSRRPRIANRSSRNGERSASLVPVVMRCAIASPSPAECLNPCPEQGDTSSTPLSPGVRR